MGFISFVILDVGFYFLNFIGLSANIFIGYSRVLFLNCFYPNKGRREKISSFAWVEEGGVGVVDSHTLVPPLNAAPRLIIEGFIFHLFFLCPLLHHPRCGSIYSILKNVGIFFI